MPHHQKGVIYFVCLMEWQQRYNLRFAQVLRGLAATKSPLICEPKHLEAFERLKNELLSTLCLLILIQLLTLTCFVMLEKLLTNKERERVE